MSKGEKTVLAVFVTAAFFWIVPGLLAGIGDNGHLELWGCFGNHFFLTQTDEFADTLGCLSAVAAEHADLQAHLAEPGNCFGGIYFRFFKVSKACQLFSPLH